MLIEFVSVDDRGEKRILISEWWRNCVIAYFSGEFVGGEKNTIIRYGTVWVIWWIDCVCWSDLQNWTLSVEHWTQNIEHCTLNKEYWTLNIVHWLKSIEHWTLSSMTDGTIVCVGLILNVAGSLRGSNQKPKFDHTAVPHASTDGTLMGGIMPHTWKSNNARKYHQVAWANITN